MRYETILFDLDGTLVDTVELIVASHRHATATVLGESPSDDILKAGIGRPLLAQMETIAPGRGEELLLAYRAHNDVHHDDLLRTYDGVVELVERLHGAGATLGVVTSKSRVTVARAFRLVPLEPLLDVVVTLDDCPLHKPDPGPVRHALTLLGREPAGACYVGDSPFDLQAGRAAGVAPIAVTWGAGTEEALRAENPDAVAATPSELEGILTGDAR